MTKVYFPRLIMPIAGILSPIVDFLVAMVDPGPDDGLLRVRADGQRRLPAVICPARARDLARRWSVVVCPERPVPGLPVYGPVPDPDLDVRIAGRLLDVHGTGAIPMIYGLNPMAGVIEGFRWALLGTAPPSGIIGLSVVVVLVLLVSGAFYFKKMEQYFADIV